MPLLSSKALAKGFFRKALVAGSALPRSRPVGGSAGVIPTTGNTSRQASRPFIVWATGNGNMPRHLRLPYHQPNPRETITQKQRLDLLRSLLDLDAGYFVRARQPPGRPPSLVMDMPPAVAAQAIDYTAGYAEDHATAAGITCASYTPPPESTPMTLNSGYLWSW
jgi:hypothetical protein